MGSMNNCQSCGYPPQQQQTAPVHSNCSWCGEPLIGATNFGSTQTTPMTGMNDLNTGMKGMNLETERSTAKLGSENPQSEINRV